MTTIRWMFRSATRIAIAAAALLGGIIAAPAAFATEVPLPGTGDTSTTAVPATVHTVTVGGTPGWQIALFVVAAALLAAVVAVLLDRMRTGRRRELAPSAH
jgi:membrane protein implicated in regulation of membrane protease activity